MKIICIGRNYVDHAKELNNPVPSQPLFFLKPDSAIPQRGAPFFIPNFSQEIHYELELVVRINKLGKNIAEKFAYKYYQEIGLGIDFTARDIQKKCKEKGHPWEIAKSFDGAAPISSKFINKELLNINNINFELLKNEEVVQSGNSADMIFSIDCLISYISKFITLKIGDLIFTGTPAGVGKIAQGDVLEGILAGEKILTVKVK